MRCPHSVTFRKNLQYAHMQTFEAPTVARPIDSDCVGAAPKPNPSKGVSYSICQARAGDCRCCHAGDSRSCARGCWLVRVEFNGLNILHGVSLWTPVVSEVDAATPLLELYDAYRCEDDWADANLTELLRYLMRSKYLKVPEPWRLRLPDL